RDMSKADIELVTEQPAQIVKVGSEFGRNTHEAAWKLADEICRVADYATEGKLAVWKGQPKGTIECAWAELCSAVEGRFPDALESKRARVELERESRAAFALARQQGESATRLKGESPAAKDELDSAQTRELAAAGRPLQEAVSSARPGNKLPPPTA